MKQKLFYLVVFLLVGFFTSVNAQTPTFNLSITNQTQTAANVYTFDIYLLNTSTNTFELGGCQLGISYNTAILNGGTITVTRVSGSSQLNASDQQSTFNTLTAGAIKIPSRAPSGPGFGTIISQVAPGTRVGTLTVTLSVASFGSAAANMLWSLTAVPYQTKISAYLSSVNTDISTSGTYIADPGNPVLPVELTSFTSNVSGRQVNLSWETKTEVNSNKFEIDRAIVGKDASIVWSTVGTVQASGNSNSSKKYSFTEKNLQAGKYQYRLKMVDNDGTFKYSDVVETEVALPKVFELSQNYPNPFNPSTKIDYQVPTDAKVMVEVYNITGQKVVELVNQDQQAGYYSVSFGTSNKLASGVYIYRMIATEKATGNNFSSIKKMMLLK